MIRGADALGRLGGDEFVVISEELSLDVGPELIAERLLDALKEPFKLGEDRESRDRDREHRDRGGRANLRRRAVARRGHRDVPGQVGRQASLCRVRDRHAGHNPDPHGARDGPARSPGERRVLPRLSAHPRSSGHEAQRSGGPDPLEAPDARRRPTRRLHPAARGDRADRRGRKMGSEGGLRVRVPRGERPDIRSASPSTSPDASSTPTSSSPTSKTRSATAPWTRRR